MSLRDIPSASGDKHAEAFTRCGCEIRRKGTHIILAKPGCPYNLSIPRHKQVSKALIAKQLKLAEITVDEYREAFFGAKRR